MSPSPDVIETIEQHGKALMRAGEYRLALKVLALCLDWRRQMTERAFHCDIDESAGLAEVVELHGYSKKAPCA